jgi:hypothetical protein
MKKMILLVTGALLITGIYSCNEPAKKEEKGVKVEGQNGGEMKIDKDKLDIKGSKGGELKMDSNGVKVKEANKKD